MLLVPSSAARKPVETLWFGQICMTNSYSASLHRRNLLRHMGAAGLGVALGSLSPLNAAWAQAQPPRTGRFAPGGDYLTAPPGLMAPDRVRLQSGLVQPLAFYDRDGGETFLSAYRGKVTLIQFWRTRCHGCQEKVPALDRLAGEMEGAKFELLPIALSEDSLADIDRFYARKNIRHLEIFRDTTSLVFDILAPKHPRFQAKATPTTMLIGADGQVLGAYVGVAGWERPAGRALLNHYISQA